MFIIDRLMDKIDEKSNPMVVGLDPRIQFIPDSIKKEAVREFGNSKQGAAEAVYRFIEGLLNELHSLIPAVKIQIACYELYGHHGIEVFERTVKLAKRLGLLVINDSKRNDIGSTAELYALKYLGKTPLIEGEEEEENGSDFLTINPFLGSDTISPFSRECKKNNRGLFILTRTSNQSAREYQEALIDGKLLYQKIAEDINTLGRNFISKRGFSAIGAVVGATWPQEAAILRKIMPAAYFLVPGYGAQGGTADQVVFSFNQQGYGALINSSRNIIYAYLAPRFRAQFPDQKLYAKASVQAVVEMRDDLLQALSRADKLPANW